MGGDGGSRRNESVTRPLARPSGRGCGLRLVPDSAWSSLPSESVGRPGTAAAPVDALAAGLQVPWASLRWFGPAVARVALMRCRVGGPPRWLDQWSRAVWLAAGNVPWPICLRVGLPLLLFRVMGVPPAGRGPARWEWLRMLEVSTESWGFHRRDVARRDGSGPACWFALSKSWECGPRDVARRAGPSSTCW